MVSATILMLATVPIGREENFAIPWARIVLALLFCLALAVAAIAVRRRRLGFSATPSFASLLAFNGAREDRELELLERLQLSPTSQICLIRCGHRRLLLHISAAGAQLLGEPDDIQGGSGE